MGTLPPEGMGSLLDCGTVHRGKTAWHQNNHQNLLLGPTLEISLDEQCILIYAEKHAENHER